MSELLLELLSEEIPAGMQARAAEDLRLLVTRELERAGFAVEEAQAFATPRRLALVLRGLPARQATRTVERRGPRADAPERARQGFLRGLGEVAYRLDEREEKKGRVLVAIFEEKGQPTRDILASILPELLARFPWPRSMRWGEGEARWVRPLRSILCLFDGQVVPFAFAGIESGDVTRGHRFMAPDRFQVRDVADYRAKLEAAWVMLDPAARRRLIAEEAADLADGRNLRLRHDPGLLDELAGLVEWPVALSGRIDADSMELPPEVLTTSMRTHQRYLAVEDDSGRLAPFFVAIANLKAADDGAAIVAGNERVLRARLWDARFFWEQDQKPLPWNVDELPLRLRPGPDRPPWAADIGKPLDSRLPALEKVVFHEKLGSLGEKTVRLQQLAGWLCNHVQGAEHDPCVRAALLAKADLRTGMVGEFPELQGIMGGYYARAQGESDIVATAMAEHYAPKGPDDRCPTAPVSVVVALADKLDALAGFFAAGIRPTGSGDPFGLRRAALGVIRLVLENGLRLPLRDAIVQALNGEGYAQRFASSTFRSTAGEIMAVIADRLKVHLRGEGVRHDLITAGFATGQEDDLVRLMARVEALAAFVGSDDGRNLLTAYRRASNIVAIEEKRDSTSYASSPTPALLVEPAEVRLHAALREAERDIEVALKDEEYGAAMTTLAGLRGPVDTFFDAVMVNAPEPERRVNRLRLLSLIRSALGSVADFSLIEDTC